ncbi:hypothetical protein BaRGS_00008744 [Batillaria attramentaria]|uniref:Uncharacterized protein n=1 Tax=Batillaria attramentaria TaxID=370345 RepID=A0ABD0LKV9_9CAEN
MQPRTSLNEMENKRAGESGILFSDKRFTFYAMRIRHHFLLYMYLKRANVVTADGHNPPFPRTFLPSGTDRPGPRLGQQTACYSGKISPFSSGQRDRSQETTEVLLFIGHIAPDCVRVFRVPRGLREKITAEG